MPKPLAFLPEVPGDIEDARDWYAEQNVRVSHQFLADLERVLRLIENYPAQAGYHDDRWLYRVRRLKRFPYLVVYREYTDRTLIVAVSHGSRHPEYWSERID